MENRINDLIKKERDGRFGVGVFESRIIELFNYYHSQKTKDIVKEIEERYREKNGLVNIVDIYGGDAAPIENEVNFLQSLLKKLQ